MALQRIERDGIQDDAINAAKIEDGTVAGQDIVDGTITNTQINASAAIATSKISGLGTAATLAVGTGANQVVQLDGSGNLPALNASALTNLDATDLSGALPAISGASLTGVTTDTSAMENNIAILAFKTQSANNLTKFNLVDQVIDEYKDDTGLGTQTTCDRVGSTAADGYMATIVSSTIVNAWTIEWYAKFHSQKDVMMFDLSNNAANKGVRIMNNAGMSMVVWINGSTAITVSNAAGQYWDANAWQKFALIRDSSRNLRLYQRQGDSTDYSIFRGENTTGIVVLQPESGQDRPYIGGTYNSSGSPGTGYSYSHTTGSGTGYMDEWRISQVARHTGTGNYTHPSGEYASDSDTVALAHFENNLTDSSSNTHTITGSGTGFSGTAVRGSYSCEIGNNDYVYLPNGSFNVADTRSSTTTNATGTLISTANTALSAPTTGDICMLIENASGTATLNTHIKAFVSRNGGSGWDQATLVDKGSWGTNKKILVANNVAFSNSASGTDMRYKIEWAGQASGTRETRVHATSLAWA